MKKTVFIFSSLIIAILALFQVSKYTYASGDMAMETIIALIAVTFLLLGMYLNKRSLRKKDGDDTIDENKIEALGLSKREYEVLQHMAKGQSNKEIADSLFLSESTIKTHVSNVLVKLDCKRRTQAIQKAKELKIL
ncbi:response regulator transcription factor [Flagellimonas sp. DF-77]|uniref:response regulator transcription factor n=1 Tax=Flagellimonas algarum TaxID=3230298 RepID=UPI0033966A87